MNASLSKTGEILINKHFSSEPEFKKINIRNSEIQQQNRAPHLLSNIQKGKNFVPLANKNAKYMMPFTYPCFS